jgi:phage terminase small subunit
MRGRKKQSLAIKRLKGNPSKERLEDLERAAEGTPSPAAQAVPIEMPAFLKTARSREIFASVIADYAATRIARRPDAIGFGRWAFYVDRWIDTAEQLKGVIYTSKSKHGTLMRKHPALGAIADLERCLQSLEDRLGLNPVARQNYLRGLAVLPAPLAGLFDETAPTAETKPDTTDAALGLLQRKATPIDQLN